MKRFKSLVVAAVLCMAPIGIVAAAHATGNPTPQTTSTEKATDTASSVMVKLAKSWASEDPERIRETGSKLTAPGSDARAFVMNRADQIEAHNASPGKSKRPWAHRFEDGSALCRFPPSKGNASKSNPDCFGWFTAQERDDQGRVTTFDACDIPITGSVSFGGDGDRNDRATIEHTSTFGIWMSLEVTNHTDSALTGADMGWTFDDPDNIVLAELLEYVGPETIEPGKSAMVRLVFGQSDPDGKTMPLEGHRDLSGGRIILEDFDLSVRHP